MSLDRTMERPGARIRYRVGEGDGRAVVFTHGAGMDHTSFTALAERVQEAGFRPVLWDQRGHGESTLDAHVRFRAADTLADLGALLKELNLARPILVGHSLGGNLSQAFVRAEPDRVAALIVIGATWNAGPLTSVERVALRLAAPALALIPARRLPGLMARASAVTPGAIAATEAVFARMPKARFLDVWRATVSFVDPDDSYRTPVPLALMHGAEDRTGNIVSAMRRWALVEGIVAYVIEDAGHLPMLDAPDETAHDLLEILSLLPDTAPH
ncbi:alpha/beta fold hydrolase [Microbacterium keratanolyticum]|uniref:alpha/beta fold hydrolase n=1 Tax=Microbacterium keratanolyticum TaxID=67574 RepID=UPI00362618D5